jgi:hypothetical protein
MKTKKERGFLYNVFLNKEITKNINGIKVGFYVSIYFKKRF